MESLFWEQRDGTRPLTPSSAMTLEMPTYVIALVRKRPERKTAASPPGLLRVALAWGRTPDSVRSVSIGARTTQEDLAKYQLATLSALWDTLHYQESKGGGGTSRIVAYRPLEHLLCLDEALLHANLREVPLRLPNGRLTQLIDPHERARALSAATRDALWRLASGDGLEVAGDALEAEARRQVAYCLLVEEHFRKKVLACPSCNAAAGPAVSVPPAPPSTPPSLYLCIDVERKGARHADAVLQVGVAWYEGASGGAAPRRANFSFHYPERPFEKRCFDVFWTQHSGVLEKVHSEIASKEGGADGEWRRLLRLLEELRAAHPRILLIFERAAFDLAFLITFLRTAVPHLPELPSLLLQLPAVGTLGAVRGFRWADSLIRQASNLTKETHYAADDALHKLTLFTMAEQYLQCLRSCSRCNHKDPDPDPEPEPEPEPVCR